MNRASAFLSQVDAVRYADNRQGVSAETLKRLKEHFSDAEIAELTITVGLWNALSRFHRAMDFELDMPAPPAQIEAAL